MLLTPPVVAMLLVLTLVPTMALMVLGARRLAMRRAARSAIGGRGRLHVRLVALFSAIAAVPTLMVVIFASLLFQSGVQFWFSDRARTILENADNVAQVYAEENKERIYRDVRAMAGDVVSDINQYGLDTSGFGEALFLQTVYRDLTEAAVISFSNTGQLQLRGGVNLDDRPLERRFPASVLSELRGGETRVVTDAGDRVEAVVRLDPDEELYLYTSRKVNPAALRLIEEARSAAGFYRETLKSVADAAIPLQRRAAAGIAADRRHLDLDRADRRRPLVRPVAQLVDAARRVAGGELSARVPTPRSNDEVATLGNAFNQMTTTIEEQTGELLRANKQLESRRAFTEAVLSGVSAGILSVDNDRQVRLINSSAEGLLKTTKEQAVAGPWPCCSGARPPAR